MPILIGLSKQSIATWRSTELNIEEDAKQFSTTIQKLESNTDTEGAHEWSNSDD